MAETPYKRVLLNICKKRKRKKKRKKEYYTIKVWEHDSFEVILRN